MNSRAFIAVGAIGLAIAALLVSSRLNNLRMAAIKALPETYNRGYEAGGRFVVSCYSRSNVYLSPLVVSNSMTISNCLFLNYHNWSAITVDNVATSAQVHIQAHTISVDSTHAVIQ